MSKLAFDGQDVTLSARGSVSAEKLDLNFAAGVARLAPVDPRLAGWLKAQGHVVGPTSEVALATQLTGDVNAEGQSSGPFTAELQAQGLPHEPSGRLTARGALLGSPIALAMAGGRAPDGTLQLTIRQASWKSAQANGTVSLRKGGTLPLGQIRLSIADLADFGPLLGKPLTGSISAAVDATPQEARFTAQATDAGLPGTGAIGKLALRATVGSLTSRPVVDAELTANGVRAGKIAGSARLVASGPTDALALRLAADVANLAGSPAKLTSQGELDATSRALTLASLRANWKQKELRLLEPVRFDVAYGLDIQHLRLGLDQAVVRVNGRVTPSLDLTASLRDLPASLAALVSPSFAATGLISAEARLSGTLSQPEGVIRAQASGLKLDTPTYRDLPPASLTATADLRGTAARLDARLAAGSSYLTVSGRAPFSTTAPLNLRADGAVDLALADPLFAAPGERAAGRMTLAAAVTGTAAKPDGTVHVQASDVRMLNGPGQALPPARLTAVANLHAGKARIDSRLAAGPSHLAVAGTAVLASAGALDLRTTGAIDLAMLNPLIAANGESVHGTLALDAGVIGTTAAPRLTGGATLSGADVRDYAEGVHLGSITARIEAAGDTLRLVSFSGVAGQGTMTAHGTVGLLAHAIPVDLVITARNATPIAGDLVTARMNADLAITGEAENRLTLGGVVNVREAAIQVPATMPPSVATIPVRIAGAPPPPPPKPSTVAVVIAMNLTIAAPQQIYVRGRGLNAELGGRIHITGTTKNMQPSGGFKLIRGTFNLVGNTLTFDSGSIDFNGGSLTDPALHLVATSVSSTMTANLVVGGTARDPTITLTSTPPLPQDQILAQLLFHTNAALSPFQLASIAAGLAEISGKGGALTSPLQGVQNALGLDQLGIGTGPNGNPTLQAGTHLTRRIYVGAQQATGGTGAQGTVQFDITKGLKLNATVGSGEATTAIGSSGESSGASVGLTYQFQY